MCVNFRQIVCVLALHNAVALLLQPISLFVFFAASASPHLHGVSHLRENCREETSSCLITANVAQSINGLLAAC